MLIASRAIMGIAGATVAPSTLSLIFTMFLDPKQRTTAIGFWIAAYSAGGAIGPVLGGVLLEFFWWGSVFLIGVPVMGLLLILGPRTLPEYKDPNARRLDLRSAAMSLLAILAVVYGLKEIAQDGIAALPVALDHRGHRARDRVRASPAAASSRRSSTCACSGSARSAPRSGRTSSASSSSSATSSSSRSTCSSSWGCRRSRRRVWSLPSAIGFIVGSVAAPKIIHRFRPSVIMGSGMADRGGRDGDCCSAWDSTPAPGICLIVVASIVISLGLAPVITLATELIVGSAPPEQAGAATGMSETSGELGGALGIAILGSVGTAVYRTEVADVAPARDPSGGRGRGAGHARRRARDRRDAPRGPRGGARRGSAESPSSTRSTSWPRWPPLARSLTAIGAAAALRSVPARPEPAPEGDTAEPIAA